MFSTDLGRRTTPPTAECGVIICLMPGSIAFRCSFFMHNTLWLSNLSLVICILTNTEQNAPKLLTQTCSRTKDLEFGISDNSLVKFSFLCPTVLCFSSPRPTFWLSFLKAHTDDLGTCPSDTICGDTKMWTPWFYHYAVRQQMYTLYLADNKTMGVNHMWGELFVGWNFCWASQNANLN